MSSAGVRSPTRRTLNKHSRRSMSDLHLTHCQLCGTPCSGSAGLFTHYHSSPRHPSCPRCNTGFFDLHDLEKHAAEKHPRIQCCGLSIAAEDLEEHYFVSANHTRCDECEIGFAGDRDLREHNKVKHSRHVCTVCEKEFASADELKVHHKTRGVHILCEFCNAPFKTTGAMIDHYANTHLAAALNDEHSEEEAASIVALSPIRATPPPERSMSMPTIRAPLLLPQDPATSNSLTSSPAVMSDLSFLSMSGEFPAQFQTPSVVARNLAAIADGEVGLPPSLAYSPVLFLRSTPPQAGARRAPTPADTPSGDLSDLRILAGTPMRAARISPLLRPAAHVHEVLSESEEEGEGMDSTFDFVEDEEGTEEEDEDADGTQVLTAPHRQDSFFDAETPTGDDPRRISFLDVGAQTPVSTLSRATSFFDAISIAAQTPTQERGPVLEDESEAERPSPASVRSSPLAINVAAARDASKVAGSRIVIETDSEAEPGTPTPSPRPLPPAWNGSKNGASPVPAHVVDSPPPGSLATPPRSGEATPPTATWRADTPPTATFGSAVWAPSRLVPREREQAPVTPPRSDPRESTPPASRMSVQSPRPAGQPSPPLIIPRTPSHSGSGAHQPLSMAHLAAAVPLPTSQPGTPPTAHNALPQPAARPSMAHAHSVPLARQAPMPAPAYAIPLPPSTSSTPTLPHTHVPSSRQSYPPQSSVPRRLSTASPPPPSAPHAPIPRQGLPHTHTLPRAFAASPSPPARFSAPTPPRSHPATPPRPPATFRPPAVAVPLPPSAPASPPPPASPRPRLAQAGAPVVGLGPRRVSTPGALTRMTSPLASPPVSASGSPTLKHSPPASAHAHTHPHHRAGSHARSSSVSSSRTRSASVSSLRAVSVPDADSDADDEGELEREAEAPRAKHSAFFCRAKGCAQDPAVAPTVTACGHLFCHGCIDAEVRATAHCPVCGAAQLLFALLRLELGDA